MGSWAEEVTQSPPKRASDALIHRRLCPLRGSAAGSPWRSLALALPRVRYRISFAKNCEGA
jgi:hypothetical protein